MSFIINFDNSTDKASFQTTNFSYTDKLNLTNEATINIPGSDILARQIVTNGSTFEILRNGTIELSGKVIGVTYLDGGAISARCKGFEFEASKRKTSKTVYQSTASASIFTAQINAFNAAYLGTIEAGVNLDFKVDKGSTYSNVFSNLISKSDQDLEFDYVNKLINVRNHKGSQTSVLTLNDYIQIKDLGYDFAEPLGNIIEVYGKGDGEQQIVSDPAEGRNASSIAQFGEIEKTVRDPTIISVDEANLLANVLAAKYGEEMKTYSFSVNNPNQDIVSGDVITLSAPEKNINAVDVRIVGIKRGIRDTKEFLELQVTNKAYSELMKSTDKIISDIQQNSLDRQTYMQGTTNVLTFSQQINATNNAPLRVQGSFPDSFIRDEAGNLRVDSFTVDYDVDPFRSSVGTANVTESNKNPPISGATGSADTLELYDSVSLSFTPGSSAWFFSALSGLSLPTYRSDEFVQISIRIAAGEFITSGVQGYTEFLLTDNNWDNYQGHVVTFKGGYSIQSGDYLLNQSYVLDDWESGSCEYAIGTDIFGYDLDITVEAYRGYKDHPHSSLSGNAANHLHDVAVSVGDDVSDAGSLNATQVSIYVDFWNGSSWVQKHSILNTGETLETDVDISNGGTLPDSAGMWRVRIFTDNAGADLVNGIIKLKHALDT